jgi:hypothetical protein
MAITCPTKTTYSTTELKATFGDAKVTGVLPATPNPSSDRDSTSMLTSTAITRIVSTLKSSGIVPIATTKDTDGYIAKKAEFIKNVQAEYCFYDSRYKYTLEKLFGAIRDGYNSNTTETSTTIQEYLMLSQTLNKRLNDLTQIINGVIEDMLKVTSEMEEEIAAFVKKIQEQQVKLNEQNKIITSGEAAVKIKKEMVKYTEEKARNSNNLLNLYSFLNVVALGLLVYVYKAAN